MKVSESARYKLRRGLKQLAIELGHDAKSAALIGGHVRELLHLHPTFGPIFVICPALKYYMDKKLLGLYYWVDEPYRIRLDKRIEAARDKPKPECAQVVTNLLAQARMMGKI